MLIRNENNTFSEFPDELAARILASRVKYDNPGTRCNKLDEPLYHEAEDVNAQIHIFLGGLWDEKRPLDENIVEIESILDEDFHQPTEKALAVAFDSIELYKKEIEPDLSKVGMVDVSLILP